jgi:hypothetical protein
MTRDKIIQMAREAGFHCYNGCADGIDADLERFATLVAAAAKAEWMQLFTDPENQPTQHGTVTIEYMQLEIAAAKEEEREACAKVCDKFPWTPPALQAAIRARSNT